MMFLSHYYSNLKYPLKDNNGIVSNVYSVTMIVHVTIVALKAQMMYPEAPFQNSSEIQFKTIVSFSLQALTVSAVPNNGLEGDSRHVFMKFSINRKTYLHVHTSGTESMSFSTIIPSFPTTVTKAAVWNQMERVFDVVDDDSLGNVTTKVIYEWSSATKSLHD